MWHFAFCTFQIYFKKKERKGSEAWYKPHVHPTARWQISTRTTTAIMTLLSIWDRSTPLLLNKTFSFRNNEQKLFVSCVKAFKAVNKSTIARWVKSVMTSTSSMGHKGVPIIYYIQIKAWLWPFGAPTLMILWGPPQTEPPFNSPAPVLNIFYSRYILPTFT